MQNAILEQIQKCTTTEAILALVNAYSAISGHPELPEDRIQWRALKQDPDFAPVFDDVVFSEASKKISSLPQRKKLKPGKISISHHQIDLLSRSFHRFASESQSKLMACMSSYFDEDVGVYVSEHESSIPMNALLFSAIAVIEIVKPLFSGIGNKLIDDNEASQYWDNPEKQNDLLNESRDASISGVDYLILKNSAGAIAQIILSYIGRDKEAEMAKNLIDDEFYGNDELLDEHTADLKKCYELRNLNDRKAYKKLCDMFRNL